MRKDLNTKALRAAMCDLYKASLRGESGKRLGSMIRRMAVRFLSAETVSAQIKEVYNENQDLD